MTPISVCLQMSRKIHKGLFLFHCASRFRPATKARPHLEYIIAHAGEHRYRQEAQNALKALSLG